MVDKVKTITIEGTPSGDGECFCLDVTEEVYRSFRGEEAYRDELSYREQLAADFESGQVPFMQPWRIFPHELLGYRKDKIKLTITIESSK